MEDLQRLRASRKAYQAHLTQIYKKITEVKNLTTFDEMAINTLESCRQQLERKEILTKLDEQVMAAITKPEDLEIEVFESEELHSTLIERYSELTTFVDTNKQFRHQISLTSHPQLPHSIYNPIFNKKTLFHQRLIMLQLTQLIPQKL